MKRLLIRLPNLAILPESLSGHWRLSPAYFGAVLTLFEKTGLKPDYALGKETEAIVLSVALAVSADTQTTITLRSVFEQHEADLLQLYSRSDGCLQLKDINFFNTFYVYLDDATADLLRKRLIDVGIVVTESIPQPFSINSKFNPVSYVLPDYLTKMGITDVWKHPGGGGTGNHAKCVLTEFSFRPDRSVQPELCQPAPPIPADDRRIQAQWDAVLDQTTPNITYINHSDHTLSTLVASHSFPTGYDKYKGIVPQATIQGLVSVYQIIPPITYHEPGLAPYHPEIAILKAILRADRDAILLIEFELNENKPVETDYVIFWLIYMAVNCFGITVVEPAGNGNQPIDTPSIYDPALVVGGVILDSGAILVGAANQFYRNKYNYSSRQTNRFIFAPVPINVFPSAGSSFDGTSAASAIIAGVSCQIQSVYFTKYGRYLTPAALRTKLCTRTSQSISVTLLLPGSLPRLIGFIPKVDNIISSL